MTKCIRVPRVIVALAALLAVMVVAPSGARAQGPVPGPGPGPGPGQAATIEVHIVKAGFIFGVSGGEGVLNFQGRSFPLVIGGVSVGASIGAAAADLYGEVYNLYSPYDIEGIYGATQSGYAVAGGGSAAILQNARGVELHLRGRQVGLEFSIDLSGMSIALQ